jgi:hypothetical protein
MRQSDMTKRVLRHWRRASAAELAEGMAWYARAGELADALSAGAPITRAQACGVIAALSPRQQWVTNVTGAVALVDAYARGESDPPSVGLGLSRSRAWAILHHPGDPLDVLGGPKVRAFYANIMGDAHAVTVDVWAARAAEGRRDDRAPTRGRYRRIADAYRAAADIAGVTPREMQAAVWVHVRGLTT